MLKKNDICFISIGYQLLIIKNEIIKVNAGMSEQIIKVGLSPSKKILTICFNNSPSKMMKNTFSFI